MDSESRWIYERMKLHHLMQTQPDWSNRQYARTLEHDPKWVRKWKQRLQTAAPLTLKTFQSQSRAPHTRPRAITPEVKTLVRDLRHELSEKFHRPAGAKTIQYGMRSYQHLATPLPRSTSTITRILHEMGCILPPRPRWHEPLVLPPPLEEWELDFGEIYVGDAGVFEFMVVVDRGTSRLVYLEASQGYNAETALAAVSRLFTLHGLPKRLRFDRDVRLWGAWTRDSYPSPMMRFLRVVGVEPVVCPPHRPDLKPFVERTIFTLKYEWLARFAPDTLADAYEVLAKFPRYYNTERPHQGRACGNRPPDEAFPVLPTLPALPETVSPDAWLNAEHGRVYRRRINSNGTIQIDQHIYFVSSPDAGQAVLVHLDAHRQTFRVTLAKRVVKDLPVQGLYRHEMDFASYLIAMQAEARTVAYHHHRLWERAGDLP
jgi:transposase InsO family protein